MHQSVVPSYLYDPVTYGVSPTTNWWYSSHQKWDVHPPKLCSLLSCYLRYVAREGERKIEASCTLGSWHLSSLELSEICGWRVRSGRYLKHQRFWENYSQDRWGCLWTWDGPANSWLFSWGKSGNMVTQWMEWLSPEFSGAQSMDGWHLLRPEQCPRFHTPTKTRLRSLVSRQMFWGGYPGVRKNGEATIGLGFPRDNSYVPYVHGGFSSTQ